MVQRRRHATREELVALLAEYINVHTGDTVDERSIAAAIDALAAHEVAVGALVTIAVDEPDHPAP